MIETKNEEKKSPILFAGTKYYDVLMDVLKIVSESAILSDYHRWTTSLHQYFILVSPYISKEKADEFEEKLNSLREKCKRIKSIEGKRTTIKSLDEELSFLQRNLVIESRELLNKTGGTEELEWKFDRMRGETS